MKEHKTILLIEDNPDDIALAQRAFEHNNYQIDLIVITNGQAALDLINQKGKYHQQKIRSIDLIILDINIPKINGMEVLRHIRNNKNIQSLPVIILSSSEHPDDKSQALKYGANSYINKPISYKKFEQLIHSITKYWFDINTPIIKSTK